MKTTKIFTIGSATFDIFLRPDDQEVIQIKDKSGSKKFLCLEYGAKVPTHEIHETYGGGAMNLAVGFTRMGFDACPVSRIGLMYGDKILQNLKDNQVCSEFIKTTKSKQTAFSVILNIFDGDRTVLAHPGANQKLNVKDLPLEAMTKADWIYLGHLSKDDTGIPEAILKLLKKNPKIKLAWNPGHEQFLQGIKAWKELLKHTEVLILNKDEASKFTGQPYEPARVKQVERACHVHAKAGFLPPYADDVTQIIQTLSKTGVTYTVITDGKNGVQATDGQNLYFCPVYTQRRVDTLGAGDAFATGFISALIFGKHLKEALRYGTVSASSVVAQYGAQAGLMSRGELEGTLKACKLCVSSSRLTK